jgi:hypothetical protein
VKGKNVKSVVNLSKKMRFTLTPFRCIGWFELMTHVKPELELGGKVASKCGHAANLPDISGNQSKKEHPLDQTVFDEGLLTASAAGEPT